MSNLLIILAAFYLILIAFIMLLEVTHHEKTMGINKKGELVWMKKKELEQLRKKYLKEFAVSFISYKKPDVSTSVAAS